MRRMDLVHVVDLSNDVLVVDCPFTVEGCAYVVDHVLLVLKIHMN